MLRNLSLTKKIPLALLIFSLMPMAVLGLIVYQATEMLATDNVQYLQAVASHMTDKMDRQLFERYSTEVMHDVIHIRHQVLWSMAVATAAIIVCGFRIGRRLSKPLLSMVDCAQAIAAGNLTGTVNVECQDEMGALAQAFNTMSVQLRQMLQGITTHAATLQQAAGRLEMTSACMAQNTNDMSEKTTLTASTAKAMSANMALATASAEDATNNVDSVAVATEEMTATVSDIARNAEQARQVTTAAVSSVTVASQRVGELGRAAHDISQVTDVIMEIAEQTKLLALNATIEAARAGEAGKGFAVVANEVKELAKQTNMATEDIREKIAAMQRSTEGTVAEIGQIHQVIVDVNDLVASIATAVEQQALTTRGIATNVGQAATGIKEMLGTVTHAAGVSEMIATEVAAVSDSSGEIEAYSGQIKSSATELIDLGQELQTLVKHLTLAEEIMA